MTLEHDSFTVSDGIVGLGNMVRMDTKRAAERNLCCSEDIETVNVLVN